MSEARASGAPARTIGLIGIVLIAANGMIGTGIFALPGKLNEAVGSFAPLLLLGAGLGMACIALSFGDCARHFDRTGGPLLYVSEAFGRVPGFTVGWLAYVSRIASIAANATVLATTLAVFLPFAATPLGRSLLIALLFAVLIGINIVGVKRAIAAIGAVTVLKVVPLVGVAIAALLQFGPGDVAPVFPPMSSIEQVALVALYAFTAFEAATVPAAEAKDPKRLIPIALVGTVLAITLLYMVVQWAFDASGLPPSDTPLVDLSRSIGGQWLAAVMAVTIILSIIGNQASAILSNSRYTVGMAEQGMIPAKFAAYSPRFATPVPSILLYGLSAMALALSGTFIFLAAVSALARLFAYLGCILAAPKLDQLYGTRRGWARVFLFPAVGAALCLWAMTQTKPEEWQLVALLAGGGILLYFLAGWGQRQSRHV